MTGLDTCKIQVGAKKKSYNNNIIYPPSRFFPMTPTDCCNWNKLENEDNFVYCFKKDINTDKNKNRKKRESYETKLIRHNQQWDNKQVILLAKLSWNCISNESYTHLSLSLCFDVSFLSLYAVCLSICLYLSSFAICFISFK